MPFYHTLGQIPRKRHIAFRRPDGGLYSEQLVGHEGFTGTSALLYHIHPPTTVKSVRRLREECIEADPDETLRHRHFRTSRISAKGSPTLDRVPLLFNADVTMHYVEPDKADEHFYRNAQADEIVYVSKGTGTVETQYGDLSFREGDYVVLHRGIMHRYRFDASGGQPKLLIIEGKGHTRPPKRYRNEYGQLIEGAPYSERDIRVPRELRTFDQMGDFPIVVKQYDGLNEIVLDHDPRDVVGWDGQFYPWAFNIMDFEPIVGRVHQPPPVHQTFQGDGFVVCSFCPRPYDFHPEAVPAPYNHSNVPEGHRVRLDHAASGRHSARSASGPRRGVDRREIHRRAGRHDGHLPPTQGGETCAAHRGSGVSPKLDRRAACRVQSAHELSPSRGT